MQMFVRIGVASTANRFIRIHVRKTHLRKTFTLLPNTGGGLTYSARSEAIITWLAIQG